MSRKFWILSGFECPEGLANYRCFGGLDSYKELGLRFFGLLISLSLPSIYPYSVPYLSRVSRNRYLKVLLSTSNIRVHSPAQFSPCHYITVQLVVARPFGDTLVCKDPPHTPIILICDPLRYKHVGILGTYNEPAPSHF